MCSINTWSVISIHPAVVRRRNLFAGDFTGNGRSNLAVWRPAAGNWTISGVGAIPWGSAATQDFPITEDFNGDGKSDIAVWRRGNGTWYVRGIGTWQLGAPGDVPAAADFDGDRKVQY